MSDDPLVWAWLAEDDARLHEYIMEREIPPKLADAIWRAPDLAENITIDMAATAKKWGITPLDPDTMPPTTRRTLALTCKGYTVDQTAKLLHYSFETVKSHRKALRVAFGARNTAHLAALAVAQGYVDMMEKGQK